MEKDFKKKTGSGRKSLEEYGPLIKNNSVGRRPLGRPHLRWEHCVKKDTETVDLTSHWRDLVEGKDR